MTMTHECELVQEKVGLFMLLLAGGGCLISNFDEDSRKKLLQQL